MDKAAEKKNRPGTFERGHDPRRANVAAPKEVPPRVEVEGTGLLAAMRHVLANDKAHDANDEQRQVRKWLRESVTTFFTKKADLEKAEKSAGGGGGTVGSASEPGPDPPPPDFGTAKCLDLIDQLLGEAP